MSRRKDVMQPKLTINHEHFVQQLIAGGRKGPGLPRAYFEHFPSNITLARDLLWLGRVRWERDTLVVVEARTP